MINYSLLWTDNQLKTETYVLSIFKHKIKLILFHKPFNYFWLFIFLMLLLTDLLSCWKKQKTLYLLNQTSHIGFRSEKSQIQLKSSNKFNWLISLLLKKATWISKSSPTTNGDWSSFCIVYRTQSLFFTTLKMTF